MERLREEHEDELEDMDRRVKGEVRGVEVELAELRERIMEEEMRIDHFKDIIKAKATQDIEISEKKTKSLKEKKTKRKRSGSKKRKRTK